MVGLANYGKSFGVLNNPVNDAKYIVKSLEKHGVKSKDIIELTSGNEDSFVLEEEFSNFVKLCSPGDLAFIFFAGHGCAFNNHQCLMALPLSNDRRKEKNEGKKQTILQSSLQIEKMLALLRKEGITQHLLLLDCCREFKTKDVLRGGAEDELADVPHAPMNVSLGPGTTIGYATSPGDYALDGGKVDGKKADNGKDTSYGPPYTSYYKC